jgi:predicted acylesterase/phospholipase RssA
VAQLDIGLTLPGEGSLGAFEAGAVAALLVGLQAITKKDADALSLDAITGASSGALTAVLAAGALLTGEDPIMPLRRAWVSEPSLGSLWGRSSAAPLSLERAREVGQALLTDMLRSASDGAGGPERPRQSGVTLEFAMACLRGFSYEFPLRNPPTKNRERRVATSYLDWSQHRLGPGDAKGLTRAKAPPGGWLEALNAAIASASDPLVFPPTLLHRSQQDFKNYEKNGVSNLPLEIECEDPLACEELWYSDGGLVDREPVGRCLRLVNRLDQAEEKKKRTRIVVVIRPRADLVPQPDDAAWTGAGDSPRWRTTLARAYRIMTTHSLYEDLRRAEKTNNRIAWADQLVECLGDAMRTDPEVKKALEELAGRIQSDRNAWNQPLPDSGNEQAPPDSGNEQAPPDSANEQPPQDPANEQPPPDPANEQPPQGSGNKQQPEGSDAEQQSQDSNKKQPPQDPDRDPLDIVVRAAAGLEGKRQVAIEVVAPPDAVRLAGGARGFLAERLRANDFLAGYRQMVDWMEKRFQEYELDHWQTGASAARSRMTDIPGWTGGVSVDRRTAARGSATLLRGGLRAGRLGLREIPVPRKPSR